MARIYKLFVFSKPIIDKNEKRIYKDENKSCIHALFENNRQRQENAMIVFRFHPPIFLFDERHRKNKNEYLHFCMVDNLNIIAGYRYTKRHRLIHTALYVDEYSRHVINIS
jgi:hypothetical protein